MTTRNDYLIISEAYYIYILFGNLSVPSKCQSIQVGNRSKTSFEEPKFNCWIPFCLVEKVITFCILKQARRKEMKNMETS